MRRVAGKEEKMSEFQTPGQNETPEEKQKPDGNPEENLNPGAKPEDNPNADKNPEAKPEEKQTGTPGAGENSEKSGNCNHAGDRPNPDKILSIFPFPMRTARRSFSRLGFAAFLASFLANAAMVLVSLIWPELVSDGLCSALLSALFLQVLGLGIATLVVRPVPAVAPERQKMTAASFLRMFCIGYALLYMGNLVGNTFASFLSMGSGADNPLYTLVEQTPFWAQAFLMVIIGPVFEELFFRHVLINRMLIYGDRAAILVSALMFGLFHGNFFQFFYAFAVGLLFGYVYVRTGNIGYSIGLHAGLNLLGGVLPSLLLQPMMRVLEALYNFSAEIAANPEADMEALLSGLMMPELIWIGLYELAVLVLFVVGAVFLFTRIRQIRLDPGKLPFPPKTSIAVTFGNAGMAIYVAFCVILFVLSLYAV